MKEDFFEAVKSDIVNTVASYFAPVTAVINEVSRAVASEAPKQPADKSARC